MAKAKKHTAGAYQPKTQDYKTAGLIVLIGGLIITSQAATQFLAWRLRYDYALGNPIIAHLYAPGSWVVWMWKWVRLGSRLFYVTFFFFIVAYLIEVRAYVLVTGILKNKPRAYEGISGPAHFADKEYVANTRVLPTDG